MRKIIVMNAKGGCGKTTIATSLASLYATHGYKTALIDYDPQGSSSAWLKRRPVDAASIHGVAAYQQSGWSATRSWQMRMPAEMDRVIVDTPAAIKGFDVAAYLKDVNAIVVPVLSSVIDVEASALFLQEAMKVAKVRSSQMDIVVVASRVRARSPALKVMAEIFSDMGIKVVGQLRDTVNHIQCTDLGLGIHDLPAGRAQLERRALSEVAAAIDVDFEQMLSTGRLDRQTVNSQRQVTLSIPQATVGHYGFSWK